MHPLAIQIGPLSIHWYGILVAVGFLAGLWLADRRAPSPAGRGLHVRGGGRVGREPPSAFRRPAAQPARSGGNGDFPDGHVEVSHETRHADGDGQQHQRAAAQRRVFARRQGLGGDCAQSG